MFKIRYRGRVRLEDNFDLPLSWLNSHVVVTGMWRVGGKRFMHKLANQINEKYPEIGQLYISHFDIELDKCYPWDACYDINKDDLQLPYFYGSVKDSENVKQWVATITSALGFSNAFKEQFKQYIQGEFSKGEKLPKYLPSLFEQFRKLNFKTKALPPEDYYSLFAYSENTDKTWNRFNMINNHVNIKWVNQLFSGKNVFIEMKNVCSYHQNLAFLLALQNLRTRIRWNSSSFPRVLVFIEQGAHQLLRNHGFHYGAGHDQLVSNILESFKKKAVSLIVEDDNMRSLDNYFINSAKLKVFFRSQCHQYNGFSFDEGEMRTIECLSDQEAVIYSNE